MQGGERLPRSARLRDRRDFGRVGRLGRRLFCGEFVVLVAPARLAPASGGRARTTGSRVAVRRLGLTVSRRVGKAVVRNRVKRAVREWFRRSQLRWGAEVDVVVVARPAAAGCTAAEIAVHLTELLRGARAGYS